MCICLLIKEERIKMHGTHNFKIINAQEASTIDTYRNVTYRVRQKELPDLGGA